jgi:uncharacterized protein (DUF1015 family)
MTRNRMEQLGEGGGIEIPRPILDHSQPKVDVSKEATLLGRSKRGAASELSYAPHIVQERSSEQEVVAETWVELGGLAAERRDADRVLEQSAGIAVMPICARRRERPERAPDLGVPGEGVDHCCQTLVRDLGRDELEEALELVCVPSQRRGQRRRVGILRGLDRPNFDLEPPTEALDAAEHPHSVTLAEPLVQELDVVPDPRVDASARIGELESEIRRAGARTPALLLRYREHALDRPVLGELGDGGHVASLCRWAVGTLAAMADAQPFRAVRYTGAAGSLPDLVAPPYDAVGDAERAELYTRSVYNVVHVTLPESTGEAGRLYREWLARGILAQDDEQAVWLAAERFVGPDGVSRERHGLVVSLAVEPYETGAVLPHERTHPRVRDERLRLLRATRVQPEPILALADTSIRLELPAAQPALEVDGTRLWQVNVPEVDVGQLLIADGHHRYESALDFGAELGASGARIMALVVGKDDPGLHVFPTHRLFVGRSDLETLREGESCRDLDEALLLLSEEPYGHPAAIAYRRGSIELVRGSEGELDVELVDRHGLDGIAYTPRGEEAVAAVDRGAAVVAFLLREQRVEDIFAVARRGERMPPKSTYFFPKPLAGLLFHPLDR